MKPDIGADEIVSANLSSLTTTALGLSPVFAQGTMSYTASVNNATTSVTVTPTVLDTNATVQVRVNGGSYAPVTSGSPSASLPLNVGNNPVDVLVTTEFGSPVATYTIVVMRAMLGIEDWRVTYFGTVSNSGNAANTGNPDGDAL